MNLGEPRRRYRPNGRARKSSTGFRFGWRVEHVAPVGRAVDDKERHVEPELRIGALQLVGLVDRHLRILVAMQQHERRVLAVHMRDGAGQRRQFRAPVGGRAEQALQCRPPHVEPNGVDCARIVRRSEAP